MEKIIYRYLSNDDITNPHSFVGRFFFNDSEIEDIRKDILDFIKASCTNGLFTKYGDRQEYFFHFKQSVQLMEIAYILHLSGQDFSINSEHKLFRSKNKHFAAYIGEEQYMSTPSVYFRTLTDNEVNNIDLFFRDLFKFLSLEEWIDILEKLMSSAHQEQSFDQTYDCGHLIVPILEYIEKLIESIYLIFHTKSFDHIKKHHATEFYLNKNSRL